jgi:dihydrofolate reductase
MYGDVPCWVFTHRDLPPVEDANVFMISGDVRRVHEAMMVAAQGKNVWLAGGGDLVSQFVAQGLLDEIILGIAPAILGDGIPLLRRRVHVDDLILTGVREVGQFAYLTYAVGDVARLGRHLATESVTRIPSYG